VIRPVIAALLMAASPPLTAQTIAITNGTVATGDGSGPMQNGTVVIRNGRIVAAGPGVRIPPGAQVIDATGKWVTPGIVGGFTRLGLSEVDLSADGSEDTNNDGPFSAAIDVVPSVNPLASTIAVSRADGVTRALVAPATGKSIFAGQGAVIDTGRDMDPITRPRVFQFVELGESGAGTAGGSRSSAHVLFRNALREAAELRRYAAPVQGARGSTAPKHGAARTCCSPDLTRPHWSRSFRAGNICSSTSSGRATSSRCWH
jgi:hypothetical protein